MVSAFNEPPYFFLCCITQRKLSLSIGAKRRDGWDWRDLDLAFTIDPVLSEYHALAYIIVEVHFGT
jgi:hypothetical protein